MIYIKVLFINFHFPYYSGVGQIWTLFFHTVLKCQNEKLCKKHNVGQIEGGLMYKLGSFQKRDNLPYWLFFIFKKINRVGQIWTRVGQLWTVSELPLRNVADLKKIIKICGAYDKKQCVKKLWKYIYICGRYGRKSNFAPPWKKPWKFNVLFCPTAFFGTVQICPMDSIISSSVSNPTPLAVR